MRKGKWLLAGRTDWSTAEVERRKMDGQMDGMGGTKERKWGRAGGWHEKAKMGEKGEVGRGSQRCCC
jgi:hypothetical protein